ncbi:MAG: Xaa-Pro peptidase family protein [marine benthic group bacterium]|nr:Xaa-Pro peptidase family protein [Candidatus Carthagonibacter metallireducens]
MNSDQGPDRRESRLRSLRDRLHDERIDGLLVSHPPDIRYMSGFSGSSGLLLIEPGLATLFTDFRYEEQARGEVGESISLVIASDGLFDSLAERLSERPPGSRIGFDPAATSVQDRSELERRCGTAIWDPVSGAVAELRTIKDPGELGHIEKAVQVAETAFDETLGRIRPGMSEQEIAADLIHALRIAGSGPLPFEPIVASGPRSALPHAFPGPRVAERGDLLLLDFGARVGGYCSDLTRVMVFGPAQPWQRDLHEAVNEACLRAIASARDGIPACEVDAAARDFLGELGLADRFGHSTGHGIGLEVHEAPRVHKREDRPLVAGNVVTIEPGVYLPGRGGVRIEQDVVIEAGGRRTLGRSSTNLIEL